ncbi:MAG: 50S ribosomal protein L9 [Acholeplasmatales bacterium]|nr:50S ribosomal protein L9 [Acholeplasmatales bacterium]
MKRFLAHAKYIIFAILFASGSAVSGYFTYYYFIEDKRLPVAFTFLGLCILAAVLTTICFSLLLNIKKRKEIKELKTKVNKWTNISYHASKAGDEVFNKLPIGIMLYDNLNQIIWANQHAKNIFHSNLIDLSLDFISKDLVDDVILEKTEMLLKYEDKSYDVVHNIEYNILYLFDSTEREKVKKRYNERITTLGIIKLDNFEESLKRYDLQEQANIRGKILSVISEYIARFKCYFDQQADRIVVVMDKIALSGMIEDKFSLLDDIRQIAKNSRLKSSISMGVACYDNELSELGKLADNAVELAEKRGGDQVVVNEEGEQIKFFGAKSNSQEKNTLIEARLQTQSLKEQVELSSNVIIMCHKYADTDAMGSALAALRMIETSNKEVKLAFDPKLADATVNKIFKLLLDDPKTKSCFISLNEALEKMKPQTLLLITDTQSPRLVMFPELYEKAKRVSIIDHHRPGDVGYDNYLTYYLDSSASSSVELVSEMFVFYSSEIKITNLEASIMLSGIIVDTNDFTQRSGSRTFEAAATLKSLGADMIFVRQLLQEPIESERFMNEALSKVELFGNKFAIVSIDEDHIIEEKPTLAKISDMALKIAGVEASFTIGKLKDGSVGISARSLGDLLNVQVVMEQMDGGGHFNSAATQRKGVTVKELYDELTRILDLEYIQGGTGTMKIILSADVKGKGKKGTVIEVANGYANFLIQNGQAELANEENLKKYEEAKKEEENAKEANRKILLKIKDEIEGKSISVKIKVGQGGKSFGHVTTKLVCDEFEAQTGIHLDKRKVELPAEINSIGLFTATVKLDADIIARFEVKVEEA